MSGCLDGWIEGSKEGWMDGWIGVGDVGVDGRMGGGWKIGEMSGGVSHLGCYNKIP